MSAPPLYATPRNPARRTRGGKVARVAELLGMPLMPWQRQVADVALEVDPDTGHYWYRLIVISVQRQAGKSALANPVQLHRALTIPRGRVWNGAQLRQDARDHWLGLVEQVEDSVLGELAVIRRSNGQEQMTLHRSTVRPFNATADKALHGRQSDLLAIDEAWAFTLEQGTALIQAAVPTQLTRPGAQTWIYSAAGNASSTWFRPYVLDGRASVTDFDPAARAAFFEWAIPEDTEDLEDLSVYARCHPAVGHTIDLSALEAARAQFKSLAEFARAYGNYWTSAAEWAIAPALWEAARTVEPIRMGAGARVAFAAEVAADKASAAIAVAGHLPDGTWAVDVVDERPGTGWVAARLHELVDRHRPVALVIDPGSVSASVHRAVAEQRRNAAAVLADFDTGDLVAAHTELIDALAARTVRHRSGTVLDRAVGAVGTRKLRETAVFSREMTEGGDSPAPILAAMLALYGLRHPVRIAPEPIGATNG